NMPLVSALTRNVSQVCFKDSLNTTCVGAGNTLQGRRRFIYSAVVTLPPCNTWTFGWGNCCRNGGAGGVVNLSTAGNFYMETTMNSGTDSCNNSVRYTGVQNPYVCINQPATYNFGGFDPDGDSLVYTLVPAMMNAGTNYTYNAPYSGLNPIVGIALNFSTGTITFTPTSLGSFVVVVKVFEYDSLGRLVGTTMRDIQIVVYNCAANIAPDPNPTAFYNLRGQGVIAGPKKLEVCEGDTFCVDFVVADSNAGDTLSLWSTNIGSVLPGATLTYTGINPIIGTLCWSVPTGGNAMNSISVSVDDGFCPIPARASFSLSIEVIKSTYVSPDLTICLGDSAILTARGGNTFTWTTLSGPPISLGTNFNCDTCNPVEAKPVSTTTYEVTSDLSGGCNNKDTVTVTVAANFLYNLSQSSGSSCRLDPINFAITPITPGTYTYQWSPALMLSSDTIPNPVLNPTQGGLLKYQIVAVNAQGCTKIDTISVFVSNGLVPDALAFSDKDTVKCNDIANLSSWVDTAASQSDFIDDFDNSLSPYSFLSNITGGAIGTGCGANSPPNSLNFNGNGIRTLQTASIQVGNCTTIEYSFRLGNAASGFLCDHAENTDPVFFQYSTNGGVSWTTLRNHNYLGWLVTTGWQNFSFNMPIGVSNAIFRWHQPVHGGAGQDNWAVDDIKISCSSLNNYSYVWSPSPSLTTPNSHTTIAQPQVGTNYQLIVTDTTGGCADTAYVYVEASTDYPDIDISIDTSNGCEPVTVTFTNNTDPSRIGTIEWDFGDGNTSTALTNPMVHTYLSNGTYSVYVKITSPNGCVSDTTYTNLVEVYDIPVAFFNANPQPTNISSPNISFYDLSSSFVSQWTWDFGINLPGYATTSNLQNPRIKYPDNGSGVYTVTLIVGSPQGCFDTITKDVVIEGLYTLYLPSSFTPNGDGLNDEFGPTGEQIDPKDYQFMIFNRWGEVLFSTSDVQETWTGRVNNTGNLLPEGVYVWRILATDGNSKKQHEYIGHVTLLRNPKKE
ncbi:MAG: gliding motility-associated C-terminal domain-containing protein, partial [Flavobacteriales bacterium]